jgi:glycosidase
MLSIGGFINPDDWTLNDQNPWPNGLGIFDMTTLSWTKGYDPDALAYERPSLVSQFYTDNSRYPTVWGDPELESIFTSPNGTGGIVKDVVGGVKYRSVSYHCFNLLEAVLVQEKRERSQKVQRSW